MRLVHYYPHSCVLFKVMKLGLLLCSASPSEILNIQHVFLVTVTQLEQYHCVIKNLNENSWHQTNCDKYSVSHWTWKRWRDWTFLFFLALLQCGSGKFWFFFLHLAYLFSLFYTDLVQVAVITGIKWKRVIMLIINSFWKRQ